MSSSDWPPKEGLCTPTTPRSSGVLSLSASTTISAPASLVFTIIRETDKYPEWNQWCPRVTILSQPDGEHRDSKLLVLNTSYILHALMDTSKPSKDTPTQLRITDLSTPEAPKSDYLGELLQDPTFTSDLSKVYRIAWKGEGSFLAIGLQTERFHEVIVLNENECEVRTWEVMSGPVAYTVKWMFKKNLEEKFKLWVSDLKKRAESLHGTATNT
ncbi:uncharacterized protein PV09_05074 [Verruconis gallopava]|uniref:Coenzyme Q-binding protein COQ10 START domain-containing protein n=1 Tax=Verruconis gallopava TaxID=253628 RepID=A0A0D2AAY4_9PEZI|nr:uncharacterized protein PV09_05074 [Verruconis gallopava]KIW03770.1 hypothetical protein PV09_05074 [Verruconis gallopava]